MKQLIVILLLCISFASFSKDIPTMGRVKVVTEYADYRVKIVKDYPDIRIKKIDSTPKRDGEWQFVKEHPDFTIQYVTEGEDFTVTFVNCYPSLINKREFSRPR
jgi:hypothetical protein